MRLASYFMNIRGPSPGRNRIGAAESPSPALSRTALSLFAVIVTLLASGLFTAVFPRVSMAAEQEKPAIGTVVKDPGDPFDMAHRLEAGMHAGYLGIDSMSRDVRFLDSELDWGGTMRYWFTGNVSAGAAYHRWYHDDDFPDTGLYTGLNGGPGSAGFDEYGRGSFRLNLDVWDLSVFYNFPISRLFKKWKASVMGGVSFWDGVYRYLHDPSVVSVIPGTANSGNRFVSLSLAPATQKVAAGIDGHDWADFTVAGSTWGTHVGAGVEYWFDSDFSMKLEGRYNHGHLLMDMAPDLVTGLSDKESLDVSGWSYGAGFSYHFPVPDWAKDKGKEKDEVFPY